MSIVLEERINLSKASFLLETYTFDKFYSQFSGTKADAKKEYKKMTDYLTAKVKNEDNYVKYDYSNKKGCGRLFSSNSIQQCKRNVRGFVCDGLTTDIDMVNAHPCILLKICEEHEMHCPNLTLYCNDRAKYLQDIMQCDKIGREQAKSKVLAVINSNRASRTQCDFLKSLDRELGKIQKKLLELPEFEYIKAFARNEGNFEGSFINHLICVYEDNILTLMRSFCAANEVQIHSLMFDGLMVYGEMSEGTLRQMGQYIHEKSIFDNIQLHIKEHSYDFVLPKDYTPKKLVAYEDVRKEFEKQNCKVGHQFVCELTDQIAIYKRSDFETLHEELTYHDGEEMPFMATWFKDAKKRRYDTFDMYPKQGLCPANVYNLWMPFPVVDYPSLEPNERLTNALTWFLNHIKVMVDYDETCYAFVCTWIAQMFQYPEHKSVELIFISAEGAGKGTFLEFFKTMMGGDKKCWETTDPEKEVFGTFNQHMKDAFLVVFNEANKSHFYNNNDKKKALITDSTININMKNVQQFTMKSYHRFITFTNNPDPSTKNKRRDVFFRMSDDKVGNAAYFEHGHAFAKDMDCCKYIYNHFMQLPTKPIITERDLPTTEYDEFIKQVQKDHVLQFLEDFVQTNEDKHKPFFVIVESLYTKFNTFCSENYLTDTRTKQAFASKLGYLKKKGMKSDVKKINKKTERVWWFDIKLLKADLGLDDEKSEDESDDESEHSEDDESEDEKPDLTGLSMEEKRAVLKKKSKDLNDKLETMTL